MKMTIMLKSFINARTGDKVVFTPDNPFTRESVEETIGMKIQGDVELAVKDEPKKAAAQKKSSKKKEKDLETTTE